MLRPTVVAAVTLLACACAPRLDWSVGFSCESASVALGVESGDCASAAGRPTTFVRNATDPSAELLFDDRAAGDHCLSAVAYRHGADEASHGALCRALATDQRTLTLPEERGLVETALTCEGSAPAATPTSDALLRNVVGCCGECDVARCVCAGGCEADVADEADLDARRGSCATACAAPIQVRDLVSGGGYFCGISLDDRSLWCWGDGGPSPIAEALAASDGEAVELPVASLQAAGIDSSVFLRIAAAGDRLCFTSDVGVGCVGAGGFSYEAAGVATPSTIAIADSLLCIGESRVLCFSNDDGGLVRITGSRALQMSAPGEEPALEDDPFLGFSELVGARAHVCGATAGHVFCATRARTCRAAEDCDAFADCDREGLGPGECRAQRIDLGTGPVGDAIAIRLSAGGSRACAILPSREVVCWDLGGGPSLMPVAWQPELEADARVSPLDVAVGDSHLCLRDSLSGETWCGRVTSGAAGLDLVDFAPLEEAPVDEVVLDGDVACVVRSADSQVVCRALSDSVTSPPLGVRHTRELASDAFRPVCP